MRGPELEAVLVGAVLDSAEPLKLLQASGLQPETFSDSQLRLCWDIAWGLARKGQRVDALTLFSAGRIAKAMRDEDLGLLQSLQARNALDARSFVQVAQDLRRWAHSRMLGQQLVELGRELQAGAQATKARGRFQAISESYNLLHAEGRRGSAAVVAAFESFERRKAADKPGLVTTGLPLLDKEITGLPPKLCLAVGSPGIGKSAFLAAAIVEQLLAGLVVVLFSLEDGDAWLVKRLLALRLGLPLREVFNRDFPDGAKAAEAAQELSQTLERLWIVTKAAARTPSDIVRISTQYVAQQNAACIWLDNMTAVQPEYVGKFDQPRMAIGRMYAAFAEFADTYEVPLVGLAHTKREYEDRTKGKSPPLLSDVAETADADRYVRLCLGLWRKKGGFRVTVTKNNEGPAGMTLQFGVHTEAAVVDGADGELINLSSESRKDREEAADRSDEFAVAREQRRREMREKLRAAQKPPEEPEKPAEPPPQLELIPAAPPEPKP